ncbi:MAG TPA: tetratricopeptide repeat protein [Puia sp.]|jgi:Tfp pilus assembly protein PilF
MEKIEKLHAFLQDSPDDPFLKHALALEYIKAGEDGQALRLFMEILSRDPDYVGSYYHLAGLLERTGDREAAIGWYEKGMIAAKKKGDQHSFNELRSAYEDLI